MTQPHIPTRETVFVSPSTGRTYWIDANGIATELQEEHEDWFGCECEIDWNCPMHQNRVGTWIETRYAGLDEDEARAHGVWHREFATAVTA